MITMHVGALAFFLMLAFAIGFVMAAFMGANREP